MPARAQVLQAPGEWTSSRRNYPRKAGSTALLVPVCEPVAKPVLRAVHLAAPQCNADGPMPVKNAASCDWKQKWPAPAATSGAHQAAPAPAGSLLSWPPRPLSTAPATIRTLAATPHLPQSAPKPPEFPDQRRETECEKYGRSSGASGQMAVP